MDAELAVQLGGEAMVLLGDRALWWPGRSALLLADLHLGKADIFRRAGIALPSGGTQGDLLRLQELVERTGCAELWILGDVLHGPLHRAAWHQHWMAWRAARPDLQVHVIRGNHDRALTGDALGVAVHDEGVDAGPFLLRHEPCRRPDRHVIAGHLHPLAAPRGLMRRFPAFWLQDGLTVLPAFSRFTAGVVPALEAGDRLVACVDGSAIELG